MGITEKVAFEKSNLTADFRSNTPRDSMEDTVMDGTRSAVVTGPDPPKAGVMDTGAKAWMTVAGAWFILFATFGYLYSFGVYQDFYTRNYLSNYTPSEIAWIGSFQIMMPFAMGVISGKLFDAGYFHALEITGSIIFVFSLFMLSLAQPQKYYQIFLSQAVGLGIGLGLTFVPAASIAVHHFKRRKALATGVALSGSSLGAVVFPILIKWVFPSANKVSGRLADHYIHFGSNLIKTHSFGTTVRASGYLVLGFLVIGNLLVRSAYENVQSKGPKPDIKRFFVDPPYMWTVLAALISTFGFYFPLIYLQLYAIKHGIDPNLSFYSIAILNSFSALGRVGANHMADIYGPINLLTPCTLITAASIFSVFGVQGHGSLIAVSIIYGLFSGAWLSLSVASLNSLARHPSETGARTGLALALGSFGSLGSAPVQGALLTDDFHWNRPIIFSGACILHLYTIKTRTGADGGHVFDRFS
ncbi:hypothetical protein CVT24_002639 [Panaeolus cyanescens]|uniref:Major facilitator superfamily (MFS) profile domain-containing protein n=1 Tax=Panaeolus cyanescens TaxID=181874 RepID=A0A409WBB6_9AGAR|nr:hypothetical protein CVT24_002639 [Panaeolus cyanescens]